MNLICPTNHNPAHCYQVVQHGYEYHRKVCSLRLPDGGRHHVEFPHQDSRVVAVLEKEGGRT